MRKILTLMIVGMLLTSYSQTNTIIFSIGNEKLGYEVTDSVIHSSTITSQNDYPILEYFVLNEKEFIGGKLINEQEKDTAIIEDLEMIFKETEGEFFIDADKFDFTFKTETGYILEVTPDSMLLVWINENKKEYYKILKK